MIIYKITNLINNKVYIGQTICSLGKRWREHRCFSSHSVLSRAIKKYGPENFKIEEIDGANAQDELNYRENFWIIKHQSYKSENGYNIKLGGSSGKQTEKIRQKISNGKLLSSKRPFNVYKLSTKEFIGTWDNQLPCSLYFNIDKKLISRCLTKSILSTNGYVFSYIDEKPIFKDRQGYLEKCRQRAIDQNNDPVLKMKMLIARGNRKFNVYKVKFLNGNNTQGKSCIYEKGELIGSWFSGADCAKDLNLSQPKVSQVLNGKRKTHKNYIFEYN